MLHLHVAKPLGHQNPPAGLVVQAIANIADKAEQAAPLPVRTQQPAKECCCSRGRCIQPLLCWTAVTALIEGEELPLGLPFCLWAQPCLLPPAHLAYPLQGTAWEPMVEIRQCTDQLRLPVCCSIESGIVQQLVLVTFAVPLDPGAGPPPPNLQACCHDTDIAKHRFRIFVAGGLLLTKCWLAYVKMKHHAEGQCLDVCWTFCHASAAAWSPSWCTHCSYTQ